MRARASTIGLLLGATAACATLEPPDLPHQAVGRFGTVRAAVRADAVALSGVVDVIAPRVISVLPDHLDFPLDIRLVDDLRHEHWGGATYKTDAARWIELPRSELGAQARAT